MEERVAFFSGPGLRLEGYLNTPKSTAFEHSKRPGIVVCHGPTGVRGFVQDDAAHWLTEKGYITLTFYYRGFGASDGVPHRLIPLEQVADIQSAITFLQAQSAIDATRIGLWGAATGGANVSFTAGVDERVKCAVSISAMGDCGRWFRSMRRYWEWCDLLERVFSDQKKRVIEGQSELLDTQHIIITEPGGSGRADVMTASGKFPEKRYLTLESVDAMRAFIPETVVHRISPRAAMWICASNDRLVPNEESFRLYERSGEPKELVVLECGHHDLYHGATFESVMDSSLKWFQRHL